MTIKTLKTAACAGALMSAVAWSGGAFAAGASGDSYDFETSGTLGTPGTYEALTGNGTVDAATYTYSARAGKPISAGESTKVLTIAGTVTYTNSAASVASTSSQVDFMFKVEPTDELENPDGSDIQVALAVGETNAVGTTAPIMLWCKTSTSGNAGWVPIKDSVNTGAWIRATLVLDYSDTTYKKCKVSLDGDPVKNGDSEWFYFAGTTVNQQFVKSISMVGSTQIDELKVSYTAPESYVIPTQGGSTTVAVSGQGSNVTYDYINKYGVTVAEATSTTPLNAESGMSVAEKFEAGLDPKSGTKFELKTMQMTESTVTVTFPGFNSEASYAVEITDANGSVINPTETSSSQTGSGEKTNTKTVTIPSANRGELLYFKVKTVTP